jgi:imidazolonepropionase-like amidohydrolase
LPVVAHAQGPGMVARALDGGVARLAHAPWTEPLDAGLLRAAAARQVWISTLAVHTGPARETAVRNLRLFLGYGGRVRYGTDLGNGPQPLGVNPAEIRLLQAAGLSPADVLAAMTAVDPGDPPAPSCVVPGGLDDDPRRFAASLATARVLD